MSKSDDNPVDIIYGQVEIREVKFLRGRYDLRLFFYPCFKPLIMGRMIKALRDQPMVIFPVLPTCYKVNFHLYYFVEEGNF